LNSDSGLILETAMRIHIVTPIVFFPQGSPLSGFHHDLFHGRASRFANFLKRRPEDVTMAKEKDLYILLNLYHTPAIIQPIVNLLVQDEVRQAISTPGGCAWKPVRVERVCNIPYAKGVRFESGEWSRKETPEELMMERSFSAKESEAVPSFQELICPDLEKFYSAYQGLKTVRLSMPINQEKSRLKINQQLLRDYPVVWHDGYHVFHEEVFKKCERFFDWDYFEHVMCDVPE
jgi:hypothetical protein